MAAVARAFNWALSFLTRMPDKNPKMSLALVVAAALYLYKKKVYNRRYDKEYIMDVASVSGGAGAGSELALRVVASSDPALQPLTMKEDVVPDLVSDMRRCFDAGLSRPYSARKKALQGMKRMFEEHKEDMLEALRADLGRPTFEGMVYDWSIPYHEVCTLLKNLAEWMRPTQVAPNLLTFPSEDMVYYQPYGVALVIGTWNYPLMLTLIPTAGAIAAGNTVILKPSNVAPASARLLAELMPRYVDPRICTVVGPGAKGDRGMIQALIGQKTDKIFFTGGATVGRMVAKAAGEHLTPCTLELGGKNPVFVAADADIDLAAKRTIWGAEMNCGQQCIRPDYVLCDSKVVTAFTAACEKHIKAFYEGRPKEPGRVGRIVNDRHMERLARMVAEAKESGGRFTCGGEFDPSERYIEPSVMVLPLSSPAMADETFGPIVMVCSVDSMDDAIRYVNSRARPLSLYIFSRSKATQERIVQNTHSGGVTINATLFHAGHPGLPFGGVGDSGLGAYHGRHTFDLFSHKRAVLRKTALPDGGLLSDLFVLYPPWTSTKMRIMEFLLKLL